MSSIPEAANRPLVCVIPAESRNIAGLKSILMKHPEIRFVSLVGVDLGGNDTDEKIPVATSITNVEEYLSGGVQTDGSSVVLPGIATLNNGKVDLIADPSVDWTVDYNHEHLDESTGRPVGTLRIPSFLIHNGAEVDSRSVLKRATEAVKARVLSLLKRRPDLCKSWGFKFDEIEDISFTSATELEFWVKTPEDKADTGQLSVSQVLQEQYWKRTKGVVRTALEKSLILLEQYGLNPEMGHKEVGGIKARLEGSGRLSHVMEQLEIDWQYDHALQAADNELLARILIKETFRRHGLDVTFMAKPIEGVAGSGEHTHVSISARLKGGKRVNLFSTTRPKESFLSVVGWGALMGLLKNYEVVGTFVTNSNDAFNRLKPGFEAPICIVASIGHSVEMPSRNRTVLVGLVRDIASPAATRFELRAPNPHTNTYLALAAMLQSMADGIEYAVSSGKSEAELEAELSKAPEESAAYLEAGRAYRAEEDVFEHFAEEERNRLFGRPPATVGEALANLDRYPEKLATLTRDGVFTDRIIESFRLAMAKQWTTELSERIIPENVNVVRACTRLHSDDEATDLDREAWDEIEAMRRYLMKDSKESKSLFERIRGAIAAGEQAEVSALQLEMAAKVAELKHRYAEYGKRIIDLQ